MSDNTLQFRWITTIVTNLQALFADRDDVFVAGDLLWYAVEGQPRIRRAPDALVAFGRPKGDRGSYKQWEENGVAPHVVFEILSPYIRPEEMDRKFDFYEYHGVEEYYVYDPDPNELLGWIRDGATFKPIANMNGWASPRLGIRFDLSGDELVIYRQDGQPFQTFAEAMEEKEQAQRLAEQERMARQQAQQRADQAQQRADQAQLRADQAQLRAEQAQQRTAELAARLRALGVDPEADAPK